MFNRLIDNAPATGIGSSHHTTPERRAFRPVMIHLFITTLITSLLSLLGAKAQPEQGFEGEWKISFLQDRRDDRKAEKTDDTLTFNGNELRSTWAGQKGFDAIPVKITFSGGQGRFDARAKKGVEEIRITGSSRDAKTLMGSMVWVNSRGRVLTYAMKGARAAGPTTKE
jgi:hypothetical protein